MRVNYSANLFAAGDFGGRTGHYESDSSIVELNSVASSLAAEHVVLLSLLPNARLTRLYGTSPAQREPSDDAPEFEIGWTAALTGKASQDTVQDRPALAVPIHDPALPGFPGVLLAYRPAGAASFSKGDVATAVEQAQQISRRLATSRHAKAAPCGVILFDSKIRSLLSSGNCLLEQLDPKVRVGLLDDAKARFGRKPRRVATRVRVRNSLGAFQNFRVELRRNLPIGDGGAVLAYTLPPRIEDWSTLDEKTFAADPDIQRLIPALKFMIQKFAVLPGLPAIAQKAKLSPFHFHREFSALLGISPKHLMLDCQIEHACEQLRRGDVELVQIARSCGFAHQSHFTSRFKQATGLTPTGWRKAMKAAAA